MEMIEREYAKFDFLDASLDLIVRGMAHKRLKGHLEIDEIYQYVVSHMIAVDFDGIVSFIDRKVYDAICDIFLSNYTYMRNQMVKRKRISNWERILKQINTDALQTTYQRHQMENPWLFQRSPKTELQDIIFFNLNEKVSPRIHAEQDYQNNIRLRIEQMISSKYFTSINIKIEVNSARKYRPKKAFHRSITRPTDSVCLSEEVQMITHNQNKQMKSGVLKHNLTIENSNTLAAECLSPIVVSTNHLTIKKLDLQNIMEKEMSEVSEGAIGLNSNCFLANF